MNFLKRALLAVTRKKGKTFIMFIIFAAIANMVLAGYAIQHATEYASVLARQKLGGELTLKYNTQKAMEKAREEGQQGGERPRIQSEPVTEDMVSKVAVQENIVNYNYIVSASGIADGFEPVTTEEEESSDTTTTDNAGPMGGMRFQGQGGDFVMPDVSITGVLYSDLIDTFANQEDKLVDGRHITNEDSGKKVAMIEKNLAEQNGLEVGEKIKIKSTASDDTEAVSEEFSIVGIYETSTTSDTSGGMGGRNFSFTQPYNKIIVDFESAQPLKVTMGETTTQGGIDSAVFYVDDPKNIDKVKADAAKMDIDWESYTLDANDMAYQQMMGPIESVASFSNTVIYIVAIAGAIILALILTLSIKERMYETGVLLSMGEGKGKIIAQYVTEVLIIALVAFSLSVVSGKYIAQGVGSVLMNRETQIVENQDYNNARTGSGGGGRGMGMGQMGGGFFNQQQNVDSVETIDSLDIRITLTEIKKMSAAGLLIIIAGTMIPAANVMRFKPKTILTKAT